MYGQLYYVIVPNRKHSRIGCILFKVVYNTTKILVSNNVCDHTVLWFVAIFQSKQGA